MRLLQASTLTFVDRDESDVPSYAILSHTWGRSDEEVWFSDMQSFSASHLVEGSENHPVLNKPGFSKIRNCANMAQSQGVDYIWVYTCCVDQSSSAEVSEAINSVFRWYQNSAVCFAHLSDVESQENSTSAEEVRSSRWFKRGWTLPELIGSREVQFYSRDWVLLGTKDARTEFQTLISDITGISADILSGYRSLESFSIAARMKWASGRATKRVEDIAYCLMGIFDINMPILYGEGMNAFIRLQQEIMKVNDDHSLFAWEATRECTKLTGLLAPSPECFKNSGKFSPLPLNRVNSTPPSSMTNIGLQTYLKLIPTSIPGEFDAILECNPYDEHRFPHKKAAIRLTALGGSQYARGISHRIFDLPKRFVERSIDKEYTLVYVKQKPIQFLPKVELLGFVDLQRMKNDMHACSPSQWPDVVGSSNRLGPVQDEVIVTAYRFRFRSRIGDFETSIDVLIGFSFGSDSFSSWSPWGVLIESDGSKPLATVVSDIQSEDLATLKKETSFRYWVKSAWCASFIISRRYEDHQPVISLKASRAEELSSQESKPTTKPVGFSKWTPSVALARDLDTEAKLEFTTRPEWALAREDEEEPLILKYQAKIEPFTVKDSADTSLKSIESPMIRINHTDDTLSSQLELEHIRRLVLQHAVGFEVLRHDQTKPDTFEAYFSDLLIKACIYKNANSATELIKSPLSVALVHSWTAQVKMNFHNFDRLKLTVGFRPLHWAALFGHSKIVDVLLEQGADPVLETSTGLTAIHIAIIMEHVDVIERLLISLPTLKPLAIKNHPGHCDTLIHFAASYIRSDAAGSILESLITKFAPDNDKGSQFNETNRMGENILHRACSMDNIHAAKWIIQWNPNLIHDRDNRGMTPLFHAAAVGSNAIVRELVDAGAKINAADELDRTPLDVACHQGHHQLVDLLLSADDALSERSSMFNAWHFAALSRTADVLKALKPYINACDRTRVEIIDAHSSEDLNALHIASSCGSLESVKVLCDAGFSTKAKSKYSITREHTERAMQVKVIKESVGKTAEEWAQIHGHDDIVEFLRLVD